MTKIEEVKKNFMEELKKAGFDSNFFEVREEEKNCVIYAITSEDYKTDDNLEKIFKIAKASSFDDVSNYKDYDGSSLVDFGDSVFINLINSDGSYFSDWLYMEY